MLGTRVGGSDRGGPRCISFGLRAPSWAAPNLHVQKWLVSLDRSRRRQANFPIWDKPFAVLSAARYWNAPIVMKPDARAAQFLAPWSPVRVS
jgi:hypothetical protein